MAERAPTLAGIYPVLEAAARLGWAPSRLRYWEARLRSELDCARTPAGDPLFTPRQLQLLAAAVHWIEDEHEDEEVARGRLGALITLDANTTPATGSAAPTVSSGSAPEPSLEPSEIIRRLDGISRGMNSLREDMRNLESLLGQLLSLFSPVTPHVAQPLTRADKLPDGPTEHRLDDASRQPDRAAPVNPLPPSPLIKCREFSVWSLPRWQPRPLGPTPDPPSPRV